LTTHPLFVPYKYYLSFASFTLPILTIVLFCRHSNNSYQGRRQHLSSSGHHGKLILLTVLFSFFSFLFALNIIFALLGSSPFLRGQSLNQLNGNQMIVHLLTHLGLIMAGLGVP